MRKAESGREGKKIPERDGGFVQARSLVGQTVVIDPGHGGPDTGCVSAGGVAEKDVTLALGLRTAELLRAEGCRVRLTRERDEAVALYARAEAANAESADYVLSLHCNFNESPEACGARLLLLPAQPLLLGARPPPGGLHRRPTCARRPGSSGGSGATTGSCARRAASPSRSSRSSSVAPRRPRPPRRPDHTEALARALVGGLADYLARAPQGGEAP